MFASVVACDVFREVGGWWLSRDGYASGLLLPRHRTFAETSVEDEVSVHLLTASTGAASAGPSRFVAGPSPHRPR